MSRRNPGFAAFIGDTWYALLSVFGRVPPPQHAVLETANAASPPVLLAESAPTLVLHVSPEAEPEPEPEPAKGVESSMAPGSPDSSPVSEKQKETHEEEGVVTEKPDTGSAVVAQVDPALAALEARSDALKARIADLSAQYAEMSQLVKDFQQAQYQSLAQTLSECLGLRLEYLRLKAAASGLAEDIAEAREAEAESAAYHSAQEAAVPSLLSLGAEEQAELRQIYRAAAMRCHPDRVAEADRVTAHGNFLRVQAAYRQGDRAGLQRMLREMLDENPAAASQNLSDLKKLVSDLGDEAADLILAIQTLQLSETYRNIVQIEDWEDAFALSRKRFEDECVALRERIQAYTSAGWG